MSHFQTPILAWTMCGEEQCSVFPSSCNIRLQERELCHPIKLQKDLNSAIWLAHKVAAVATEVASTWKNIVQQVSFPDPILGMKLGQRPIWSQMCKFPNLYQTKVPTGSCRGGTWRSVVSHTVEMNPKHDGSAVPGGNSRIPHFLLHHYIIVWFFSTPCHKTICVDLLFPRISHFPSLCGSINKTQNNTYVYQQRGSWLLSYWEFRKYNCL